MPGPGGSTWGKYRGKRRCALKVQGESGGARGAEGTVEYARAGEGAERRTASTSVNTTGMKIRSNGCIRKVR